MVVGNGLVKTSALFGSYVGLVYLSTMLGGYFADKVIGFRWQ
jgi:POT family proton-dependent oligopeptide transporter